MIKLTDEQINDFEGRLVIQDNDYWDESYISRLSLSEAMMTLFKSLTLPQIKQLAEEKNASVVKWVDFDAEDESTWPDNCSVVMAKGSNTKKPTFTLFEVSEGEPFFNRCGLINVVKWAYLPTKEK